MDIVLVNFSLLTLEAKVEDAVCFYPRESYLSVSVKVEVARLIILSRLGVSTLLLLSS